MDQDTTAGWLRFWVLPMVIFIGGLLITALLWLETREALENQAEQLLERIHQLQARQLQHTISTGEMVLDQQARQLLTVPPDQAAYNLTALPGWRSLALVDANGRLHWQTDTATSLWEPQTQLDAQAHWRNAFSRAREKQSVVTTPRFEHPTQPGQRLQALVRPTAQEGEEPAFLVAVFSPTTLIAEVLENGATNLILTQIIDLDQHDHAPLYGTRNDEAVGETVETEITLGDRRWLLRSQSSSRMAGRDSGLLQGIPVGGTALSIALALLLWQLLSRQNQMSKRSAQLQWGWDRDQRALENKHLEKEVLSRALSDSEQRTRDFIELGEAIGFELDDQATIGYVSSQVHQILGRPPTELASMALEQLLPEDERQQLRDALRDCRREHSTTLVDTRLCHINGDWVPVRLRMITITDGLSHLQGFRAMAWPRPER